MDVAQHSQVPTTSPPCLLCLGVAAVITILGIAAAVTLVTVGARRRQRFAGVRVGNVEEVGPNRARQRLGRPLQ